jgi:hypothetical protein
MGANVGHHQLKLIKRASGGQSMIQYADQDANDTYRFTINVATPHLIRWYRSIA